MPDITIRSGAIELIDSWVEERPDSAARVLRKAAEDAENCALHDEYRGAAHAAAEARDCAGMLRKAADEIESKRRAYWAARDSEKEQAEAHAREERARRTRGRRGM